jgi:uncharacterized protein (UPF0332 family)
VTLTPEDKLAVIAYRREKAFKQLDESVVLLENNFLETAVNRTYYAMYHLLNALALKNDFISSKHGQLIGWFNREYVNTGKVERSFGKMLTRAFDKRMDSDYEDFVVLDKDEVEEFINEARSFLQEVSKLI